MRITCDTNVLVRAAVSPGGPARATLDLVTVPPHVLVLSEHILVEVRRALGYDRIRSRFAVSDGDIDEFVNLLRALADIVTVPATVPPLSTDPEDDPIIATVLAGNGEVLCTLDRHFRQPLMRAYCATHAVRVLTDVELPVELRRSDEVNP